MARPLSDEKRQAIIQACAAVIADQGPGAPTSRIARQAGVAEGTVFKYFASKEQLLNALYLALKTEVARALLQDYPSESVLKEKVRHIWTRYIDWAAMNTGKRRAIQQLGVWHLLSDDTRLKTREALAEIDELQQALADDNSDLTPDFIMSIMTALAETTIDFVIHYPDERTRYSASGFAAFWRAVKGE